MGDNDVVVDTPSPRSSIDASSPVTATEFSCESAFNRLPDEIIQQILFLTDPDSFASLILVDSNWRRVSQHAQLYAHQLAKCPSYAASHDALALLPVTDDQLPELKRAFVQQVKRNLFEAYLRPSETRITLISTSISSSSCPGGEGMQFSPSPRGHHILAYNSSRIYVIDVRVSAIDIKRELKILRRPVAACIMDDASLLAVLSTEMQVDLFDLKKSPPKRVTSVILDHKPRTIALSPCGNILAAAYEGGIEVSSLDRTSVPEKRAVKCEAVDSLAFSFDGTQLLGTTTHSHLSNTVILTAPYYDPGALMGAENVSALWTTSILFPNTSRDCSHATLIQDSNNEEASWTFTYDRSFETFRAVRIDDLRNGTTYFTGPTPCVASQSKLLPCTLPAPSYHGDLVSAGFQGKDIWLYGVPEDLSAVPPTPPTPSDGSVTPNGSGRSNRGHSPRTLPRIPDSETERVPQWQVLCDKMRNTLISGRKITQLEGVSNVKWVADFGGCSTKERLVVAARGANPSRPITEEEDIDFIDGGRITLLDFDYSLNNGTRTDISIEVGTEEPEVLEEEQRDIDTEVALIRRRTVAQRRRDAGGAGNLLRGATVAIRPEQHPPLPRRAQENNDDNDDDDPLRPRRVGLPPPRPAARRPTIGSDDDDTESLEAQEALDAPYTHANPRSVSTLRRAATAAAMNQRLRPTPDPRLEYRRADGRREHPHESDADNWVPPPPPYQRDAIVDLPAFLRHPSVAPATINARAPRTAANPPRQQRQAPAAAARYNWPALPPFPRHLASQAHAARLNHAQEESASASSSAGSVHHRNFSDWTLQQRRRSSNPRPLSDSISDLYSATPPGTPGFGRGGRHWDDATSTRRQSFSLSSDSATGTFSDRFSVRGPYSNPLGLNPANYGASGPVDEQEEEEEARGDGRRNSIQESPEILPARPERTEQRGPPILDLEIPSPTLSNLRRSGMIVGNDWHPAFREETTATGSLLGVLSAEPNYFSDLDAYPHSAPPLSDGSAGGPSSWFPAPRRSGTDTSAVLTSQLSGPSHSRAPLGGSRGAGPRSPSPDQPLIISTPTGVQGAYDPPNRHLSSSHRAETPIFAPTPRHPRSNAPGTPGPTVDRLETMYNNETAATAAAPGGPSQLGPSASTASRQKLNRRRSRFRRTASRRSVARSVRRRGTTRRAGGRKKNRGEAEAEYVGVNTSAWADVPAGRGGGTDDKGKEKRCVVM